MSGSVINIKNLSTYFKYNAKTEEEQAAGEALDRLQQQTLAQQAVIEKMREALTGCVCAMQDRQAGIGITEVFDAAEVMGRKALLLQPDLSALREHDVKVVRVYASDVRNRKGSNWSHVATDAENYAERIRKGE